MPLRDHFCPPLRLELEWHSFHNAWATFMATALNARLPEGFRASPNVQSGESSGAGNGSQSESWQPAPATITLPFELAEDVSEVLVHGYRDGRYLAGAIELVSERNKDRPEARESFVAKCETYLHNGTGLIIFDGVTTRTANLHDELMARVGRSNVAPWGERLYVTAYRPIGKNGSAQLEIWREKLALGSPLPTLPLWLLYGPCVPVELEATYEDTFRQLRLPTGDA
ncbi:MAG: DUF4058 domain-containing protein [Planctomycetia bacterium]|nr:DUF4058 domain-containing protein [Planctomycetia bacterium]